MEYDKNKDADELEFEELIIDKKHMDFPDQMLDKGLMPLSFIKDAKSMRELLKPYKDSIRKNEDKENVQSLLMEMVLSFYATDLVDMKDYETYLVDKEYQTMSLKELQASLIQLFHNDRVHPDSLIHNGIGKKELVKILVEMKKRMSH